MSCYHEWQRLGEVQFCMRCGITRLPNGQIYFDRELISYDKQRKKKRVKNGKKQTTALS